MTVPSRRVATRPSSGAWPNAWTGSIGSVRDAGQARRQLKQKRRFARCSAKWSRRSAQLRPDARLAPTRRWCLRLMQPRRRCPPRRPSSWRVCSYRTGIHAPLTRACRLLLSADPPRPAPVRHTLPRGQRPCRWP